MTRRMHVTLATGIVGQQQPLVVAKLVCLSFNLRRIRIVSTSDVHISVSYLCIKYTHYYFEDERYDKKDACNITGICRAASVAKQAHHCCTVSIFIKKKSAPRGVNNHGEIWASLLVSYGQRRIPRNHQRLKMVAHTVPCNAIYQSRIVKKK